MEELDRELSPILTRLLALEPCNNHYGRQWVDEHHPDVLWLYKWLTQSTRSVEEYEHVLGPLQQKVSEMNGHGYNGYLFRIAAEALVIRCPELEGNWKRVAGLIFEIVCKKPQVVYGSVSIELSNWIIRIIGDPFLLPDPQLRLEMLNMYQTKFVKINYNNREQALESLMSVCAYLDRGEYRHHLTPNDLIQLFLLFSESNEEYHFAEVDESDDDCLHQYSLRVVDRLRDHRDKKRDILLTDISETLAQPQEVQSLIALLKYFSDGASIENIDGNLLDEACNDLLSLIRIFYVALHDPEVYNVTMSSVMDVMEAVFNWTKKGTLEENVDNDDYYNYECREVIDTIFEELRESPRDYDDYEPQAPIASEIIMRYKERIVKMRSLITEELKEEIPCEIHDILFNDKY